MADSVSVEQPFTVFFDKSGKPLDNGFVYVGEYGLNPQTNPIQVFWDDGLTQPAVQPIRTINGYYSRHGTPAKVFSKVASYSITVKDKHQSLVYSDLRVVSGELLKVGTVADLRLSEAKNGDTVETTGHTVIGIGSGVYKFEALSSKVDNNGAWIASSVSAGTWVLVSDSHFEQWGVLTGESDQAPLIQKCIDFNFANGVSHYGFEKSNQYTIQTNIIFKQSIKADGESYADARLRTTVDFNGAVLVVKANNLKAIVVSRDSVRINNLAIIGDGTTGVIGVYNGLITENNDNTLRRSSMRMYLDNPTFNKIDVAMKFEPALTMFGGQWGAFYHTVMNPTAIATNIMYEFRQSLGAGDCSNTRNVFVASKHVGGACTIYGEALESSTFIGIESEFITRPDSRLPDGEALALYLPFGTPSDFQANRHNIFKGFNIEGCTNYINVNAPETEIDGFMQGATNPRAKAYKYQNGYGNLGVTLGGQYITQYNSTPRFGMIQINDDGTSAGLALERNAGTGNYRLGADTDIEIVNPMVNRLQCNATSLNITNASITSDSMNVAFNADYGAYLSNPSGTVKHVGDFRPIFSNQGNLGSVSFRYKGIYSTQLSVLGLDVYSGNAAAIAGGLVGGQFYRNSSGAVMVVF